MKTIVPPLKCQGIKIKLVPWIRSVAASQNYGCWIEPFMGSGVVGFNMCPRKALFGDSNPHIIRFYQAIQSGEINTAIVKSHLQQEGDLLRNADDAGYVHYRLVRDRFNKEGSPLDFLFLSRAGFNGMMRFSKKGWWNIPFCKKPDRFAQAYITKIVNQVSCVSRLFWNEWKFVHQDYTESIAHAKAGDLIYCAPPYFGRYTDYFNNWTEPDEARLAAVLSEIPSKFILSSWHHNDYRENAAIKKYWSKFNILTREHFYHAGGREENRRPVVEALICNFDLNVVTASSYAVPVEYEQLMLLEGPRVGRPMGDSS
jgi:DNA adenine methylase